MKREQLENESLSKLSIADTAGNYFTLLSEGHDLDEHELKIVLTHSNFDAIKDLKERMDKIKQGENNERTNS